jgi:hypothetical protein
MGVTREVKELRTKQINDFMSQFESLKETDTLMISDGLKQILGESPGIDFEYGADTIVNEDTGKDEIIRDIKKIHIYYTYTDEVNDLRVSKISYIVD